MSDERCQSSDVLRALENRFNPPSKPRQYATFQEVSDGAQRRRIDFLAVNLWQSRGRDVQGIEVKVQRADWLRELAQPKADTWWGVSNRWWLAAPQGVVFDVAEIPAGWGFLECLRHGDGWRIKVKVEAEKLTPAEDWPQWLVMRLLARGDDRRKAEPDELLAAKTEALEQGRVRYEQGVEHGRRMLKDDRDAREELDALLQALGTDHWEWRHKANETRIMEIKRAIYTLDTHRLEPMARRTAQVFREMAERIESALAGDDRPEGDDVAF